MSYTHLTPCERGRLQALHEEGESSREIAEKLGRHASTISRELRRNAQKNRYCAERAQQSYHVRRQECLPAKRLAHRPLWTYLIDGLTQGWTPEEVAGRLPLEYPDDPKMRISHETIYHALYTDQRLHFLIEYLAQARPKRRKRGQGKTRRGPSIPNRTGIEHRPSSVEERIEVGHWEGDTVVGAQQRGYLVTLTERTSRLLLSQKVQTKHADIVAAAVIRALEEMPSSWVKTITFDNGTEFAEHNKMSQILPVDIYFADPYAAYQRGTNENTNGLIRRYLPKGTCFRHLTQQRLDQIVEALNNRPRKTLEYRTPLEVFQLQRQNHRAALRA